MDEEADELQEKIKVLRQTLQGCAKQDQPEEGESPGEAQGPHTSQKLKLKFSGSLSGTIYQNDSLLRYSNGDPIEIEIFRGDRIITSGDHSSLKVEIVALEHGHTWKDGWTEQDFNQKIIRSQGQVSSVLDGKTTVELESGKASLGDIHFKEGSHGKKFILAARVAIESRDIIGTSRVQEAFMDAYPFLVKTERSKANKKIGIPKLDDKVHGLKGIKIYGRYDDKLKGEGIYTVREFLKKLNETPEELRCQILDIKSEGNKSWRDMVEHARECDLTNERGLKSYIFQEQKTEIILFFNVVHGLVGAEFSGRFVAKDKFTEQEEVYVDGLSKRVAYENLKEVDYIMKDNRPVNIHASICASGNQSVPIISSASQQNIHYHQAAFLAAENLGSGSGIDCADGPLPGTAGQSAPEPSRSDNRNEIANQCVGQNHMPVGDHNNTTDDGGTDRVSMLHQQDLSSQAAAYKPSPAGEQAEQDTENASYFKFLQAQSLDERTLSQAPQTLPGTAGQSGPEPFLSDHLSEIANQGPNHTSNKGDHSTTDDGAVYGMDGVCMLDQQAFAAHDESQVNTALSFPSTWSPFEDPLGQESQQAYSAVNTQTLQYLRSMQMPSPQVEGNSADPGFDYNGSSQTY